VFHFTVASFLVSMLVSSVGFVLFYYGKRQSRVPHMGFGLALLIYPFFVSSALWIALIGGVLVALFVAALRLGW
jgi:hypothetical protein